MNKSSENIELLLLLCCIVGVITFFTFTLILTSISYESSSTSNYEDLLKKKEEKQEYLNSLEKEKRKLEENLRELEKRTVLGLKDPKLHKEDLERERERLRMELESINRKIETLRSSFPINSYDYQKLLKDREEKQNLLNSLEERKLRLEATIQEKKKVIVSQAKLPKEEKEKLNVELETNQKEHSRLSEEIEKLRNELQKVPKLVSPKTEERRKEIERLEKQVEDLNKRKDELYKQMTEIENKKKIYAKYDERIQLEGLKQKKKVLYEEVKGLRLKMITAGIEEFKNPLYIDCRNDVYVIYPEGKAVKVEELKHKGIFKDEIKGHDIVVLYVRPDGIGSFRKVYAELEESRVALCYEPLDESFGLEFLRSKAVRK